MVENLVVGAPCGIMDQMASALGRRGQLLSLLCRLVLPLALPLALAPAPALARTLTLTLILTLTLSRPAHVQPAVAIPAGVRIWGVDSGVRHSVGGSDYGSVRCAAFMTSP